MNTCTVVIDIYYEGASSTDQAIENAMSMHRALTLAIVTGRPALSTVQGDIVVPWTIVDEPKRMLCAKSSMFTCEGLMNNACVSMYESLQRCEKNNTFLHSSTRVTAHFECETADGVKTTHVKVFQWGLHVVDKTQ